MIYEGREKIPDIGVLLAVAIFVNTKQTKNNIEINDFL